MTRRKRTVSEPIFTVKLTKGLADRHRLPLDHVITVLHEVRQMIIDAGRELGAHDADFGLELLAGSTGVAFRKGSIETRLAITRDQANGLTAANTVLQTVRSLAKAQLEPAPGDNAETRIIRRLNKISSIHKSDKVDIQFSLKDPKMLRRRIATFDHAAISYARSLADAELKEESVTVFGKLKELEDRDIAEAGEKGVHGQLLLDSGQVWRVHFAEPFRSETKKCFGEQVIVTGTVSYYRVASPKIEVDSIEMDEARDYIASFDQLFGCDKELYQSDLDTLLEEIRG